MCKLGNINVVFDGKPVVEPHTNLALDLGLNDDKSAEYVWDAFTGELKAHFSISKENDAFVKWFTSLVRKFHQKKKALLWAVTHGYRVMIPIYDEEHGERMLVIRTPKMMKAVLRNSPFIPEIQVYTKDFELCEIRKGRVVKL